MSDNSSSLSPFEDLNLIKPILRTLNEIGYETPSPIQEQTIPYILEGKDVLGQAQTGTGKTAAFALPLLSSLDLKKRKPQVLVLTPTRELAIQVAEAFKGYAAHMKGFNVLPIYGGQPYGGQLERLKRGVHIVVGTPGRVTDHMRRGTLVMEDLTCLVLDEADEMLRMGFLEEVEWVLGQTPADIQIALFSATIPAAIRKISQKYLKDPVSIHIQEKTATVKTTRQRYWVVSGFHKLDALTRILEVETFDGVLIFVRTKRATVDLSEKLQARGYACAALSGDVPQRQRETTVENFKSSKLNILVATDVAARGLDVDRVSHVINYDIPSDTESYVHRIGRTGRAGRKGEAILFVTPREKRMLFIIEKATRQKIELLKFPSTQDINNRRIANFKQRITDTIAKEGLELYAQILEQYQQEHNTPMIDVAAALARLAQGSRPLLLEKKPKRTQQGGNPLQERPKNPVSSQGGNHISSTPDAGMERYRIAVGHQHQVKPGNIVGAIANEAGLSSEHIGRIHIYDSYSTVDLPEGMPRNIARILKKTRVSGQPLNIDRETAGRSEKPFEKNRKEKSRKKDKKKKRPSEKQ